MLEAGAALFVSPGTVIGHKIASQMCIQIKA